jgi:hypothetical protein
MKNPIAVIATFTGPNDLDVYVEDDRTTGEGRALSPKPTRM